MVVSNVELPGLNCGMCGYRTCDEFRGHVQKSPEALRRCIHLSKSSYSVAEPATMPIVEPPHVSCSTGCGGCASTTVSAPAAMKASKDKLQWRDSLGRDFDFYLEHFPEEPGPREIILPHNPAITRELDIQVGDTMLGRPLGMSCGCPITHCGVCTQVDRRTGVIVWCVTGPLGPRQHGFKDLGYYIAEGYEGIVKDTHAELKVGLRYFFQPRMCMLQWRHSGLLNYLNHTGDHWQVRLEGLWIG
jgi:uncharacterized Fe-S cluster-containing protein